MRRGRRGDTLTTIYSTHVAAVSMLQTGKFYEVIASLRENAKSMSSVFPSFYTQNRISEYRNLTNLSSSSWPPPLTTESTWFNAIKAQTVEEVASLGILVEGIFYTLI